LKSQLAVFSGLARTVLIAQRRPNLNLGVRHMKKLLAALILATSFAALADDAAKPADAKKTEKKAEPAKKDAAKTDAAKPAPEKTPEKK